MGPSSSPYDRHQRSLLEPRAKKTPNKTRRETKHCSESIKPHRGTEEFFSDKETGTTARSFFFYETCLDSRRTTARFGNWPTSEKGPTDDPSS